MPVGGIPRRKTLLHRALECGAIICQRFSQTTLGCIRRGSKPYEGKEDLQTSFQPLSLQEKGIPFAQIYRACNRSFFTEKQGKNLGAP